MRVFIIYLFPSMYLLMWHLKASTPKSMIAALEYRRLTWQNPHLGLFSIRFRTGPDRTEDHLGPVQNGPD